MQTFTRVKHRVKAVGSRSCITQAMETQTWMSRKAFHFGNAHFCMPESPGQLASPVMQNEFSPGLHTLKSLFLLDISLGLTVRPRILLGCGSYFFWGKNKLKGSTKNWRPLLD